MPEFAGEAQHNLIYPLHYDWDYGWRLRLHEHRLVNCYLPEEIRNELVNSLEYDLEIRPDTPEVIATLRLLGRLELPITPCRTAEELAGYFSGKSANTLPIAEHLRLQIPYLREARYHYPLRLVE